MIENDFCLRTFTSLRPNINMAFYIFDEMFTKSGICLLLLVHSMFNFISSVLEFILNIVFYLKINLSRTTFPVQLIKDQVRCYQKIPEHLVFIIEEEDISYHDCIKLILWCMHSEIRFISFYSFNSAINPTSLYEVLCKVSKSSLQNIKWGKSFHKSVTEMAKKDINGYVWSPTIEVNLFSSKSVQDSFENVILKLCQEKIKFESITVDTINQSIQEEITLPDPCFAIIFSKTFSTFGFFPWQIRVTEFLHMKTHWNLQIEDFLDALRSFAHCEQRFGK